MDQDVISTPLPSAGSPAAWLTAAAPRTRLEEDEFQAAMLLGVSRTFALTIPQLPEPLRRQVANAYLLCRIIDTIEDEPALSAAQKHDFCQRFVAITGGGGDVARFTEELAPLLSEQTIPAEHELIRRTPAVIAITLSFEAEARQALAECVRIMAEGMVAFQDLDCAHGVPALADLDRYCYHVAGVVGEMLTRLFCHYSPAIATQRETLMPLAVSFGQGLQMTNILKDIWEDHRRGACWLPQDCFSSEGFDLRDLATGENPEPFRRGLKSLIGIAHGHLKKALDYTLLIPRDETGIRNFCLWAIGMAVLTLRQINLHRDFTRGEQVKITRRSVKGVICATRLTVRHNLMLRMLFHFAGRGLPSAPPVPPPGEAPTASHAPFH